MHVAVLTILALATLTGFIFVHAGARRSKGLLASLLPLDLIAALLLAVAALQPATFEAWMQEDGWAEWATVHAFAIAALLLARRAWTSETAEEGPRWLPRLGVAAVALFCVFIAGEEISWGQRLLAFEPPEIFLQENYQQELNVHNLLKDKDVAGFELDTRFLVALIAVGYGGLLPWLRKLGRARWLQPTIDAVAPPWQLAPFFGAIAWVELSYPANLAGEACELALGLAFLTAAALTSEPKHERWRLAGLILLPVGLGLVTQPLVSAIVYGPDEALVQETEAELEQLAVDLEHEGVIRKRLRKKARIHKRLFTAVQARYFDFGTTSTFLDAQATPADGDADDPRRDRKGYFLDPWNNPYWILVIRKSGRGAIYSFGPNRRRDTTIPKNELPADFTASGDDVLVVFPM